MCFPIYSVSLSVATLYIFKNNSDVQSFILLRVIDPGIQFQFPEDFSDEVDAHVRRCQKHLISVDSLTWCVEIRLVLYSKAPWLYLCSDRPRVNHIHGSTALSPHRAERLSVGSLPALPRACLGSSTSPKTCNPFELAHFKLPVGVNVNVHGLFGWICLPCDELAARMYGTSGDSKLMDLLVTMWHLTWLFVLLGDLSVLISRGHLYLTLGIVSNCTQVLLPVRHTEVNITAFSTLFPLRNAIYRIAFKELECFHFFLLETSTPSHFGEIVLTPTSFIY